MYITLQLPLCGFHSIKFLHAIQKFFSFLQTNQSETSTLMKTSVLFQPSFPRWCLEKYKRIFSLLKDLLE